MTLDPQIAELIETLDAGFPAGAHDDRRRGPGGDSVTLRAASTPEYVGEVRDASVHGPGGSTSPCGSTARASMSEPVPTLVYAHGGGFVFCDLDSHDGSVPCFANLIPAVVVSVDYRLAPEHRWPAAAEDVYAVTQWAADTCACAGRRRRPHRRRR